MTQPSIEAAAKEMLADYQELIGYGPDGAVDSRASIEGWLWAGLRKHFSRDHAPAEPAIATFWPALLKEARILAGFGLREFAKHCGFTPSMYADAESGERPLPEASLRIIVEKIHAARVEAGRPRTDAELAEIHARTAPAEPAELPVFTTEEPLPLIRGRRPRIRQVSGYVSWVIDDGHERRGRLCGDGQWRGYYEVRVRDLCSWPDRAAALAFLKQCAESEAGK